MKKNKLLLFVVLALINVAAVFIFECTILFLEVLIINTFLFLLMLLTDFVWVKITKTKKLQPTYFFIINFIRIGLSIGFLLPQILNYEKENNPYIINFFIIYFFYLIYEIKNKTKKSQNKNN